MAWLADTSYETCSLSDCLDSQSLPAKSVVITFDDGYRALAKHALPILQRFGFRATVFPVAGYVGQQNRWDVNLFWRRMWHLDWHELRELSAAGWEIGSHSFRHDYLPALNTKKLETDLRASREMLEDHLQLAIHHLSLPFGRGNRRVFATALNCGYRTVATLGQYAPSSGNSWAGVDQRGLQQRLHVFPRRGIYLHDTLRSFRRRVESAPDSPSERRRQQAISFFSQGTVLVKSLGRIFP